VGTGKATYEFGPLLSFGPRYGLAAGARMSFLHLMRFLLTVSLIASSPVLLAQGPDTVAVEKDIEYSAVGGSQTMDIVLPREASNNPRPAVLGVGATGQKTGGRMGARPRPPVPLGYR
jgi:hypothetical protein